VENKFQPKHKEEVGLPCEGKKKSAQDKLQGRGECRKLQDTDCVSSTSIKKGKRKPACIINEENLNEILCIV
jgi:hypothetical protein